MTKQAGIGLSEVIISLFLASLILTLLTQLYLSNKRQYSEAQKLLETNFDLQWVSDLMSDSIRRAGFTPCLGIDQLKTIDRRNNDKTLLGLKIEQSPLQLIQVNRMSELFTQVIEIQSPTKVVVARDILFNEQRPVLIADCDHAEVHQILRVDTLPKSYLITLTRPLTFTFTRSIYIGEWFEEQWFIKKNAQKINSLHYKLFQTEELTSIVHSLEIKKTKVKQRELVDVVLGLDHNKTQSIIVAIRGS